jgi:hypothetical protein
LRIVPGGAPRELRFVMRSDVPIHDFAIDGRLTALETIPGQWSQFLYSAPPAAGATLFFTAEKAGRVSLRVFEVSDGWPDGIVVPPKPEGLTPFAMSDSTYAASAFDYGWPGP